MTTSVKISQSLPKLYYTPTSCSASVFITARQLGILLATETVDLHTHTTASGVDFYAINSKGNVPALVLPNGTVLNETAAILQYLADLRPEQNLLGYLGHNLRYVALNELNFVASELHPSIGAMWHKSDNTEVTQWKMNRALAKLKVLDSKLINQHYLAGNLYTVADIYAYIILNWCKHVGIDLLSTAEDFPHVLAFMERVGGLEHVKEAQAYMQKNPTSTI